MGLRTKASCADSVTENGQTDGVRKAPDTYVGFHDKFFIIKTPGAPYKIGFRHDTVAQDKALTRTEAYQTMFENASTLLRKRNTNIRLFA